MKVYEFGEENEKTFAMFPCAAEPWWVFEASAKELAREFHVYLFIADGHDEQGTTFISIEKNVKEAALYLREREIHHLDGAYGVSMGGASVIRFLAAEDISVDKAIIDAGITPYPYPKVICRLIALWDWVTVFFATKYYWIMKAAMPPERWTPKGEDPEEHYRRIFDFEKNHLSAKTIYNVFWSANNYTMPDPVPPITTKIEYWYGEEEKNARKNNLAYVCRIWPQTVVKEFEGLAHAELVMMFPKRFYAEVKRFMEAKETGNGKERF